MWAAPAAAPVPGSERDVAAADAGINMALRGDGGLGASALALALWSLLSLFAVSRARVHHLNLKNDIRQKVHLNTFGFFENGSMVVKVNSLSINNIDMGNLGNSTVGFSLDRTKNDGFSTYLDQELHDCILKYTPAGVSITLLKLDFNKKLVYVKNSGGVSLPNIVVTPHVDKATEAPAKATTAKPDHAAAAAKPDQPAAAKPDQPAAAKPDQPAAAKPDHPAAAKPDLPKADQPAQAIPGPPAPANPEPPAPAKPSKTRRDTDKVGKKTVAENPEPNPKDEKVKADKKKPKEIAVKKQDELLPMTVEGNVASFQFSFNVSSDELEGLYSLYFHSCTGVGGSGKEHTFSLDNSEILLPLFG